MKKFIKELARLEGKKSQVSIANLRETTKVIAVIIVAIDSDTPLAKEFRDYLSKFDNKAEKLKLKNPDITYEELVLKLLGRKK